MSDTDFAKLVEPVARHFWGDPTKGTVTKLSMRFGAQGSKSIDLQMGAWFDHETAEGGNVIELVMRETGADKAGAIEWLEKEGFIPPRDGQGASQPRQEARAADPGPEVPPDDDRPPAITSEGEREVEIEHYDYTDAAGAFQYRVIRFHTVDVNGAPVLGKHGNPKKTFRQKSRDASGNIVWGLNGRDVCLYHWPALQLAIEEYKTVHICEGEKDVHTVEGWGLVATTNSGGAANWRPEFAETFRGADVVILGDDDTAGHKRTEEVARSLRGIAARVRVVGFWDGKKDVTDWKEAGGSVDQLRAILDQVPDWRPAPPPSMMGAVGVHQLHDPTLRHEFLIADFLDRQGVAMMPGASGSGKTFLVLEIALCISTAMPFWGMEVKPGLVLYQAGEGKQGVTKRLDAWLKDRGVSPDASIPFQMLTKRVNLFIDDKDTDTIIAEGKAWAEFYGQPVRLVVIDTFNKAITGANEISGQDMGKVISRMERISVELDCCVLSPIHKSKEGGMRGHTSLKGDAANVIEVNELNIRDHNGRIIRTIVLDKNKDGEKGKPLRFVLRQVVLDIDEAGKAVTTCVIDKPDGDEEEYGRQGKLSLNQILALKALKQAVEDSGEPAPNGIRAGSSVRTVVKNQAWKERFIKTFPSFTATEPEAREKEAKRLLGHAGKVLLAGDYIGVDNELGISWPTGKEDRPRPQPKAIEKPKPSPLMTADDLQVPF